MHGVWKWFCHPFSAMRLNWWFQPLKSECWTNQIQWQWSDPTTRKRIMLAELWGRETFMWEAYKDLSQFSIVLSVPSFFSKNNKHRPSRHILWVIPHTKTHSCSQFFYTDTYSKCIQTLMAHWMKGTGFFPVLTIFYWNSWSGLRWSACPFLNNQYFLVSLYTRALQ